MTCHLRETSFSIAVFALRVCFIVSFGIVIVVVLTIVVVVVEIDLI
jgi:hypothetical protein